MERSLSPHLTGDDWTVCTVATKSYLPSVRVLFESVRRFHPDVHCTLLLCDRSDGYVDATQEPFEVLFAENLPIPRFTEMMARYAAVEVCCAMKPHLIKHLLKTHGHVVYLDADILALAPLTPILSSLDSHDFLLTPHMATPINERDGITPTEETFLRCGLFNLGFLAVRDTPQSHAMLDWWADRLTDRCYHWPPDGYFGDQRWMDLSVMYFPGMHALRHPGCNVAYWNLHERVVEEREGRYTANGEPLIFFHFSAFNPHAPDSLTTHPIRPALNELSVVQKLCALYGRMLLEHDFDMCRTWPYSYGTFDNGVPLTSEIRALYTLQSKELRASFGDPFRTGPGSFYEWMQQPAVRGKRGYATRLQLFLAEHFGHTYFPVENVRTGNIRVLADWLFLPDRLERFRLHPDLLRSLEPFRYRGILPGIWQKRRRRQHATPLSGNDHARRTTIPPAS